MTRRKQPKPRACLTKRKFLFVNPTDSLLRRSVGMIHVGFEFFLRLPNGFHTKIDFIDSKPLDILT